MMQTKGWAASEGRAVSEDRNFVARWSRLKRQKEELGASDASAQADKAKTVEALDLGQPGKPEAPFDVSKLPLIESISGGTDIRDFLQAGVPAELTKAALRRAWSADPAIRDFIGIAENQWDFTDPAAIPGFGPLQAGDNVHDLVAQAMGKLEDHLAPPTEVAQVTTAPEGAPSSNAHVREMQITSTEHVQVHVATQKDVAAIRETSDEASKVEAAALQHEPRANELKRRRHGRALPKPA
jgi:hypothetical protein